MDPELQEKFEAVKNKATKRVVIKGIASAVVRHSVAAVVARVVYEVCPAESKKQKLQLAVGAYAIGHTAADSCANWAKREVDESLDLIDSVRAGLKTAKEKTEEAGTTETPTE